VKESHKEEESHHFSSRPYHSCLPRQLSPVHPRRKSVASVRPSRSLGRTSVRGEPRQKKTTRGKELSNAAVVAAAAVGMRQKRDLLIAGHTQP
jgi:hypothetical protein